MKQARFKVGDKVRRSPRWWPTDRKVYVVLALEDGKDNGGRSQQAYRIRPVGPFKTTEREAWARRMDRKAYDRGTPYLEVELHPAK